MICSMCRCVGKPCEGMSKNKRACSMARLMSLQSPCSGKVSYKKAPAKDGSECLPCAPSAHSEQPVDEVAFCCRRFMRYRWRDCGIRVNVVRPPPIHGSLGSVLISAVSHLQCAPIRRSRWPCRRLAPWSVRMAGPRISNQAATVAAVRRASAGCLQQPQQQKQLAALIRTAQEGRRWKQPPRSKGMDERLMLKVDASIPASPHGSENHRI